MASRRAIRGALHSFLGTFTSRYSSFNGYWLFGFLVEYLDELRIDLLQPVSDELCGPLLVANLLAVKNFHDQLQKAGIDSAWIDQAWLTIRRLPEFIRGPINGVICDGYRVSFTVVAIMDDGRRYERVWRLFVAPHNPLVESKSV